MSNPTPPIRVSSTVLLVCITAVVCFTIAAAVALFVALPEGANTGSLVALLVASIPASVGSLVAVAKLGQLEGQVQDVQQDTNRLANGLGSAKMRDAVGQVMRPDLIDPAARPQLEADREHVQRQHDENRDPR